MKISVIIPVHNEKNTIAQIIRQIEKVGLNKEIVIVDDKSTDGTSEILRDRFSDDKNIKLIFLHKNYGKGFAVRKGLSHATGDIVIVQDADLEYDPSDYKKLIEPIEQNKVSVVYGSRFLNLNTFNYLWSCLRAKVTGKACKIGHLYPMHFLGIQVLNFLVHLLYGVKLTDEATCYKVFKKSILEKITLRSKGFEFCPEITAKVLKMGYSIYEVPISYYPRTTEHGKKIKWQDGIVAIWALLKYRFFD